MKILKLTLGTAQLGMTYGIANTLGKPNISDSLDILNYAWKQGINSFDTSPVYGNSEDIIGSFVLMNKDIKLKNLIIISKLPRIQEINSLSNEEIYKKIKNQVLESLLKLKLKSIPIYLLHHAPDMFTRDGIAIKCLNEIKNESLIDKIGVSIYNPNEAEFCLNFKEISMIQVPINLFDNRLIKMDLLQKIKKKKIIIFARSIYLQGLFFRDPNTLPKSLELARNPLLKLNDLSKEYNIDIAKLAFLYIRDIPEIDSLVLGQENLEQLIYNINLLKEKTLSQKIRTRILEEFSNISEKIINPSLWNK